MWPRSPPPTGYAETLEAVHGYTVAEVASRISTPLLISDPEGEQFWPDQSAELAALSAQRLFDWLDDPLAH